MRTHFSFQVGRAGERMLPDASDTTLEGTFVYLIRERGRLRIETDHHLLGLFDLLTWRRLLVAAGFEVVDTTLAVEDDPALLCLSAGPRSGPAPLSPRGNGIETDCVFDLASNRSRWRADRRGLTC
jgi:hypothetical protein